MDLPYMLDIHDIRDKVFRCGLTRAWELMAAPEAPEPIKLGPKATRWFRDEVLQYAQKMPRQRGTEPASLKGLSPEQAEKAKADGIKLVAKRGRVYKSAEAV